MATFKVKMKLEGFELEIEGEREDAALISDQIGRQFSTILSPIEGIVSGKEESGSQPFLDLQLTEAPKQRKSTRRSSVSRKRSGPDTETAQPLQFRHSSDKFGNPQQAWKTAQKAMWLIYVLSECGLGEEFTTRQLQEVFNQHFKQFGTITTSNVTRDLGKQKGEKPPNIGEDPTGGESKWYLTEAGVRVAQKLTADALGTSSPE